MNNEVPIHPNGFHQCNTKLTTQKASLGTHGLKTKVFLDYQTQTLTDIRQALSTGSTSLIVITIFLLDLNWSQQNKSMQNQQTLVLLKIFSRVHTQINKDIPIKCDTIKSNCYTVFFTI